MIALRPVHPDDASYLLHICSRQDWAAAQATGRYAPLSLSQEGFIHCSTPAQALSTANRFYAGRHDLLLLYIAPQKLVNELRLEPADDDIFPHIYGYLNLAAVFSVRDFLPDPDGVFRRLPPPD